MRTNGTLQYLLTEVEGGEMFDENGNPIFAEKTWSKPIPCSIKTNTDNRKGKYEDGEFRVASFDVLIEIYRKPFTAKRVQLERLGEILGEYEVQSVEPLTTVGRVRIVV